MTNIKRGQSVRRSEDQRLITGQGQYLDDIKLAGCAVLKFFRSPYAYGRITELDTKEAASLAGVLAIFTAEDLKAAGIKDIPAGSVPASSQHPGRKAIPQPPLARDFVRYVGEPVVAIVAESASVADDAIELIGFDVDEYDAVGDIATSLSQGARTVHEGVEGNVLGILEQGNQVATEAAFAKADQIIKLDVVNNRLAPCAIEPRGCAAQFDAESGQYTLYQGCQGVHALRAYVAKCMPIEPESLRVVCPDVGGGFGLKMFIQCETVSVLHACRQLGRPVKWVASRSESFLSDLHGRDHLTHAELAVKNDGTFLGMRVNINSNVGAYQSQGGAMIAWVGAYMTTGCYVMQSCYATIKLVLTNTAPVDAYRGAGRPEALYLIERLVDKAARELKMAPDQLRRKNFIAPEDFPYRVPTGQVYDSGDYARLMTQCQERADWQHFGKRREQSRAAGRLRGIGLAYYVEICSAYGSEQTHLHVTRDGKIVALVGTQSTGQGHETSYQQIVSEVLDVPASQIEICQGDTALIPTGEGTGGSRTMAIGGSSLQQTALAMMSQAKALLAHDWQVDAATITYASGVFQANDTDHTMTFLDAVERSYGDVGVTGVNAGFAASELFAPDAGTFPNGCHICEVEVDPETGVVEILRYTVQDDVGRVINPLLVQGQIMGGVAQGLGQALMEHAWYESDSAQLLTASFLDYAMPFASRMPDIDFDYTEVASPRNPLGVKGAGEAGTIGAPPALVNAVVDALFDMGIQHIDMPVTSMAVWQAMTAASKKEKREAA